MVFGASLPTLQGKLKRASWCRRPSRVAPTGAAVNCQSPDASHFSRVPPGTGQVIASRSSSSRFAYVAPEILTHHEARERVHEAAHALLHVLDPGAALVDLVLVGRAALDDVEGVAAHGHALARLAVDDEEHLDVAGFLASLRSPRGLRRARAQRGDAVLLRLHRGLRELLHALDLRERGVDLADQTHGALVLRGRLVRRELHGELAELALRAVEVLGIDDRLSRHGSRSFQGSTRAIRESCRRA